jgi:hypothetical protein
VLHGSCFNFIRGFGGEAVSPIIGDRPIDDGSAVDAFPGIKDQEKIRESFQHHQSFALRATHNYFLPCYDGNRLARGEAICEPVWQHRIINDLVLWGLLIRTILYALLHLCFQFCAAPRGREG